ncbi:unnamed protein product [Timema podura]|uniref:Uncharacterized protein n=1 Tax=Timema podura TaxID=61482 RepID=A0ABN7NSL1_TIMPD|nr:unnamed protein product [Timema podura]
MNKLARIRRSKRVDFKKIVVKTEGESSQCQTGDSLPGLKKNILLLEKKVEKLFGLDEEIFKLLVDADKDERRPFNVTNVNFGRQHGIVALQNYLNIVSQRWNSESSMGSYRSESVTGDSSLSYMRTPAWHHQKTKFNGELQECFSYWNYVTLQEMARKTLPTRAFDLRECQCSREKKLETEVSSVLGVVWNRREDTFSVIGVALQTGMPPLDYSTQGWAESPRHELAQSGGPEMGWTLWGSEFKRRRVMALAA